MIVYLNGHFLPTEQATISVNDRGFIFGDGVYEVTRVVRGNPYRMSDHMKRLGDGLDGLSIAVPDALMAALPELHLELIRRNSLADVDATVYLQITRGAPSGRNHVFPDPAVPPTVYMSATPFQSATEQLHHGIRAISVPDVRWQRCNLKTVNLLPNVLARQQAVDAGVGTALMRRDGWYTESPNANIFAVINGVIRTCPLSNYILQGVTRNAVMEIIARLEMPVQEFPIAEHELFTASEVFISSTMTEIQGITEVDGKTIGDGQPGWVTRRLLAALQTDMKLPL